jgi:hypothetical protein
VVLRMNYDVEMSIMARQGHRELTAAL